MAARRILLNAKVPMNAVCLRPLISWLRRDHNVSLWLTSHWRGQYRDPRRLIRALPNNLAFEGVHAVPSPLASLLNFDLYLSPDMALAGTRHARVKIHLFHGVSFKGASISPKALMYDHLFLFGEYQRRRFVEKGIVKAGDPRLHLIGFPKLDCLVDGSLDRKLVRAALKAPEDRPVILYAPTWRGTSLDIAGEEIVRTIASMDVHLLVKLHDHSLNRRLARRSWRGALERWRQMPNVTVVEDPDICPAMMAADLLVSDFSSVANEFTLLDRPIVFFETPDLTERYSDKQIDHAMLARRPGPAVDRATALPEAITHALAHPEEHSEERRVLAADLFHHPGTAAIRAVAKIYELAGVEVPMVTGFAINAAVRATQRQEKLIDRGRYPGQGPMAAKADAQVRE
jgi:hypothetical protein